MLYWKFVRIHLRIGVTLAALLLPAAPAAAASLRVETVTDRGATGARAVYVGDGRDNLVEIYLARNEHIDSEARDPRKVIGFLVTGAPRSPACEAISEGEQVCRVPDGTRLLAPFVYARAGKDSIWISVPRRGAVVYGGPGDDFVGGPYGADGETQLPGEIHGGPGNDDLDSGGLVYGGPGNDDLTDTGIPSRIVAGPGQDEVWGSEGADVINAGLGGDIVIDWGGNDVLRTADGQTDTVTCGDGRDKLTADGRDESDFDLGGRGPFSDCERLERVGEPLVAPFYFQQWEPGERYVTILYGCPPDGPRLCVGTGELRRNGRLVDRRRLRERAGNWGVLEFQLGSRRISRLVGKDIRITIRWRGRTGQMRSLTTTSQIYEPGPRGEDG